MIERVFSILQQAGYDISACELAEILWLAVHLDESLIPHQQPLNTSKQAVQQVLQENEPPTETTETSHSPPTSSQPNEPVSNVFLPSTIKSSSNSTNNIDSEAVSIKIPTAVALRDSLALSRALRPLMRKVPSDTENILDEEATVRRIAEADIWAPVLKPAPRRWLELTLVIEQTSTTAVWKQTITELQKLLKHHGAFRDVRTWALKVTHTNVHSEVQLFPQNSTASYSAVSYKPEVLIDPKAQRLILLVSDCISPAWRNGLIHSVLELWGSKGLITILQLLPERLWERTALASEIPVQLRSLNPAISNSKLIANGELEMKNWELEIDDQMQNRFIVEDKFKIQNYIPVITLEPEPLRTWSKVMAGSGNAETAGFKFSLHNTPTQIDTQTETIHVQSLQQLNPKFLVSRFRATASPLARSLAGLMAAAPVSLPVVQLIQQTLLRQSGQIHIAEVLMSGLLKPLPSVYQDSNPDYIEYDFIEGVRELLLDSVPISKTTSVLDTISEYIARRLGLSVTEFNARLLTPPSQTNDAKETQIRPFAQLKAQVLKRLGGVYADIAQELDQISQQKALDSINSPHQLSKFEFDVITVNRRGQEIKREPRQAQYFLEDLGNNITLEMVAIPDGKFMMGSLERKGYVNERPQHEVTVPSFFMSKYPITQAQWYAVAALPKIERDLNPDISYFRGNNLPVEQVSWHDAIEYCARLCQKTGSSYRLPSEAEWEYACRAGTTTPFHFGETITDKLALYNSSVTFASEPRGEKKEKTTAVGIFPPNAFGLHDMHGLVWEWCLDTYYGDYEAAPSDGSAWVDQTERKDNNQRETYKLLRGGSWNYVPRSCRSAFRNGIIPGLVNNSVGFRVVCGDAARTL